MNISQKWTKIATNMREWGQMMELKLIELQQSEEEGRRRRHEPDGSIVAEEDKLPRLEVDEREGASLHPVVIPW
jgi:hypothetical protein